MTEHPRSTVRNLSSVWETFWCSEGNTFNLGLFRILFAISLYLEVSVTAWWSVFAIEGGIQIEDGHLDLDQALEGERLLGT